MTMILQNDPVIHLRGIKVMTDGRRDVGVCWGGRGCWHSIPRDPRGFSKWSSWHMKILHALPRRHTPPSCSCDTINHHLLLRCSPMATLRGPETGDAVSGSKPPPRRPHSLSFVSSQCGASTVSEQWTHLSHSSPGKGSPLRFCALCVCVNLFLFHYDPFIHVKIWKARAPNLLIKVMTHTKKQSYHITVLCERCLLL